jgi:anti-anti-sigma factor
MFKTENDKHKIDFERNTSFTIVTFNCSKITTQQQNDSFLESISKQINCRSFENLIFDFSGVQFVTSSTINMLLVVLKQVRLKGGEVYFCGLAEGVRQVFEMMELFKLFNIYATRKQTVEALNSRLVSS